MANPFRYRGYYYDLETGFYYLNSRYYDPAVGRFINADGQLNPGTGLMGCNLFAYCNNPILFFDYNGYFPTFNDIGNEAIRIASKAKKVLTTTAKSLELNANAGIGLGTSVGEFGIKAESKSVYDIDIVRKQGFWQTDSKRDYCRAGIVSGDATWGIYYDTYTRVPEHEEVIGLFGGELYLGIGGGFSLDFNVSKFLAEVQ